MLYYLYTYSQYTKRDALTGLLNRQSYYSHIEKNGETIGAVISIDMNELKWLNDNYGHEAGDKGLATVSKCFKTNVSRRDKVYRIGGDEFMVLCSKDGLGNCGGKGGCNAQRPSMIPVTHVHSDTPTAAVLMR